VIILIEKKKITEQKSGLVTGDLSPTPIQNAATVLMNKGEVWSIINPQGKQLHIYAVDATRVQISPKLQKFIRESDEIDDSDFEKRYLVFVYLDFPGLSKSTIEFLGGIDSPKDLLALIKLAWS
jgi:hypothetical protein